jgi:CDP-diacylglycerol--glycerol-3-phosphate 3-phosphatidyltransferase
MNALCKILIMLTQSLQNTIDTIIDKVFLWTIPSFVKPNWLTYFRMATVPFIAWLMYDGDIKAAFILFIISALSDLLDGAMARTRDQVTDLGKIIDPIADKMLIATTLIYIGFEFWIIKVFLVFIVLEIVAILVGSTLAYKIGRPVGANIFGKIKMVLQSVSVFFFLLGIILHNNSLVLFAEYTLVVALVFAVCSAISKFTTKKFFVLKNNK